MGRKLKHVHDTLSALEQKHDGRHDAMAKDMIVIHSCISALEGKQSSKHDEIASALSDHYGKSHTLAEEVEIVKRTVRDLSEIVAQEGATLNAVKDRNGMFTHELEEMNRRVKELHDSVLGVSGKYDG